MQIVAQLMQDKPRLYASSDDRQLSYPLEWPALHWLAKMTRPGAVTLETGSGNSTLVLASRAKRHIAIDPCVGNWVLINEYAAKIGLSLDSVDFLPFKSADLLNIPHAAGVETEQLDVAVIDGAHGMPHPFLDWYLIAPLLKVGGFLLIDDLQLWPPLQLHRYLLEDTDWRLAYKGVRCVVYKKERSWKDKHWMQQPFVTRRKARPQQQQQRQQRGRTVRWHRKKRRKK